MFAEIEEEALDAAVVAESLITVRGRGSYPLDPHRSVPVIGSRDSARMGAEADQGAIVAKALATELTNIQLLADAAHLGEPGIADMGVVRPDHRLGTRPARFQHIDQRLEHMRITQVPGLHAAVIHDSVVPFRGGDQPGVLRDVEETLPILASVLQLFSQQRAAL